MVVDKLFEVVKMIMKSGLLKFCGLFLITLITLSSCTEEKEELHSGSKVALETYSVVELDSVIPRLATELTEVFDLPDFLSPYYLEPFPQEGLVVTTDRTENKIHLFDESGVHLAAAGREGRGPGEFEGSLKLHIGSDNHLYTYDLTLKRITKFKVDREGFSYVRSYLPSQEPLTWLQNIYVTKWGNFAVYRKMQTMGTGEEEFELYKLDDEFNQIELVLTMPGNQKIPLDDNRPFSLFIDHRVGKKTLWDLEGEWFYYISSHSPVINKYNLKTGESQTKTYFDLKDRVVTENIRSQLAEYSANMTESYLTVKKAIEDVKVLPFFEEFVIYDDMIYLMLFDVSKSGITEIIRINEYAEEQHYLKTSSKLRRIAVDNEKLYGIEGNEEGLSFIKVFELRKP